MISIHYVFWDSDHTLFETATDVPVDNLKLREGVTEALEYFKKNIYENHMDHLSLNQSFKFIQIVNIY